jgi:hypothetical protein
MRGDKDGRTGYVLTSDDGGIRARQAEGTSDNDDDCEAHLRGLGQSVLCT